MDLISRQEAIKAIDDLPNCYNGYSDTYDKSLIIGIIDELPSAEPKKGKWIIEKRDPQDIYEHALCSECGTYWSSPTLVESFDYCPKCGADMRGVEA